MSLVAVEQPLSVPRSLDQSDPARSVDSEALRSYEEYLAAQLGCLASQHHTSEYNCLKFGPKGAPVRYIPLSVQAPDYYKQLQEQQARYSVTQAWWPCQRSNDDNMLVVLPNDDVKTPELNLPLSASDLQEELLNAISSPLNCTNPVCPSAHAAIPIPPLPVKTSDSHPINISFLIPVELIPIISAHLVRPDQPNSPILFDLPFTHHLHRLIPAPMTRPPTFSNTPSPKHKLLPVPGISLSNWRHVTLMPHISKHAYPHAYSFANTASSVEDSNLEEIRPPPIPKPPGLVGFFLNQKLPRPSKAVTSASHVVKVSGLSSGPLAATTNITGTNITVRSQPFVATKSPYTIPLAAGAKVQKEKQSAFAHVKSSCISSDKLSSFSPSSSSVTKSSVNRCEGGGEKSRPPVPEQPPASRSYHNDRQVLNDQSASAPSVSGSSGSHGWPTQTATLGNLFLSSCPGKKVRLNGPVNGRGGVCRNLRQDLQRMKDLGVGCVVCCLDDEELQYLGAPWEDYSCTAEKIGLDVLRLPTPEGLSPPDPSVLDEHLSRLIDAYTLRGIPILVHCRGGVGRAGLVACCWTLKLGLCGWIDTQPTVVGVLRSQPATIAVAKNEGAGAQTPSCENLPDDDGCSSSSKGSVDDDMNVDARAPKLAVRRDTMQLVERVITLVRRRRSAKAVETFEQVKFLVNYVEFLRTKAKRTTGALAVYKPGSSGGGYAIDMATVVTDSLQIGSVLEGDIRTQSQSTSMREAPEI